MRIGIDLGGTKIEAVVMDGRGEILRRQRHPTPAAEGYPAILSAIEHLVRDLEAPLGTICRVGIGTPGGLSRVNGRLKNSNTVCMNDRPIKQDLEQRLQREVLIENDANCFALSEAIDGAAQNHDVVFGVIMGTGVGGGIVIQNQLHRGAQHIAGEWGHNVLETDGPACYCGRRGCVETFLSGPGLSRDYLQAGGESDTDPETVVRRAQAGEARAEQTLQRFLDRFGRAMASVINILDPDAIVLGGGLSNIQRLYDEGRERIADHVFNDELRTLILPNQHGDSSGVRGAAQLWPPET